MNWKSLLQHMFMTPPGHMGSITFSSFRAYLAPYKVTFFADWMTEPECTHTYFFRRKSALAYADRLMQHPSAINCFVDIYRFNFNIRVYGRCDNGSFYSI